MKFLHPAAAAPTEEPPPRSDTPPASRTPDLLQRMSPRSRTDSNSWPGDTDTDKSESSFRPPGAERRRGARFGRGPADAAPTSLAGLLRRDLRIALLSIGLLPDPEAPTPAGRLAGSPRAAAAEWAKAAAWTAAFCLAFFIFAYLSHMFYDSFGFSSVWLPNGLIVGAYMGLHWRARWLLPAATFATNTLSNHYVAHELWAGAAASAAAIILEILLISWVTLALASAFSRRPGVRLDLESLWHVLAFGIGMLFCLPANALYAWVQMVIQGQQGVPFPEVMLRYIDYGAVVAWTPFIVAACNTRPNWKAWKKHPLRIVGLGLILFLIISITIMLSSKLKDVLFGAVVGLFFSMPLIILSAPLTESKSRLAVVTMCAMVASIMSLIMIPCSYYVELRKGNVTDTSPGQLLLRHLLWIQICICITVFSSLLFADLLLAVDHAKATVEERVRVRTEQLRKARAAAEQADREKGAFIFFLCHELRNPLHAVSNLTESLIEERAAGLKQEAGAAALEEPASPLLGQIDTSLLVEGRREGAPAGEPAEADPLHAIHLCTGYMLALLADVLDAGRFESGAVRLDSSRTDLAEITESVSAMAGEMARTHQVAFELKMAPDVPRYVMCDRLRLQQVINNLLSNAFKFTKAGSITLSIDCGPKSAPVPADQVSIPIPSDASSTTGSSSAATAVDPTPSCRMLRITCADTGVGIPPAVLPTLFQPWTQASVSTYRDYGGSGLGLAIAAQIVALMGGEIGARSEVGVGTEFEFWVPLEECAGPEVVEGAKEARKTGADVRKGVSEMTLASGLPEAPVAALPGPFWDSQVAVDATTDPLPPPRTRRILVTDDSAINRRILVKMLRAVLARHEPATRDDWEIDEAENGAEAVDLVRADLAGPKELALVLMDVVMPVMDGFEATREIRRLQREAIEAAQAPLPTESAVSTSTLGADMDEEPWELPVVITTANQVSNSPDQEWALCGASEAISKPFGKDKIEALLVKHGCLA
ncbi:hypothetical protein DFJ74DRAFT_692105 [Hyaloraphidium curvatum]|nr:hypothetical protein DFJ74DRAFT_692105 [Hyaloraphidium curvatum]